MSADGLARCAGCRTPPELDCVGRFSPAACEQPRYRALFDRLTREGLKPPIADESTGTAGAAVRAMALARACDYLIPMPRLRDEGSEGIRDFGCGCRGVCLAGRSTKGDGLVGHECQGCPLAGPLVD